MFQNDNAITETAKEAANKVTVSLEPVIEKLDRWVDEAMSLLPNFILSLIFLILFFVFARFIRRFLNKYLVKIVDNPAAVNIISTVMYFMIITSGILFSLSIMKLDGTVNKILAGVGILSVGLGFAFQDTASNVISGTFMAFRKNFRVGDLVETNGVLGVVDEIDIRATKIKSLDGFQVIVPNKDVFQKQFTNYNTYITRRIELSCGVGYESDLDFVKEQTLDAIKTVDEIKTSPSPQLYFKEFGDSSINYVLYFWIDFLSMPDYLEARHKAIVAIRKKYKEEGINIPFPIRTLDFGKNDLTINQQTIQPMKS